MSDDLCDEEFVSRRLHRKLPPGKAVAAVTETDLFVSTIFENQIEVTGSEVITFIQHYERKLAEYLNKPFLTLLTDGILSRSLKNFAKYVLGTAICKHYTLPPKRFIEVQFYYHDQWKNREPTVHYVTSLHSEWNAIGRYRKYCSTYRTEIDYFDSGHDNVNAAYQSSAKRASIPSANPSLIAIYEDMIEFQMEANDITRKDALKLLGHPATPHLPLKYLTTLPLYRLLVEEDAWGQAVKEIDFYMKIKSEIENNRYAR